MTPTVKRRPGFPDCIGLTITFNPHAAYYQTAQAWLDEQDDYPDWVSEDERRLAIAGDSVWICQWYPETPVGFCVLAASSFEALMAAVLSNRR